MGPDGPDLGEPIQITGGSSPLSGSRLMRSGDTLYVAAGRDYPPVLLHAKFIDVLGPAAKGLPATPPRRRGTE